MTEEQIKQKAKKHANAYATPDLEDSFRTDIYEANGWEFTGWYNTHGQPIVRNKETGEELAYCRTGYHVATTCNVRIVI